MLTYSNMGGGSLELNCNKKKGFTLIELLAVIVILAIIAVIATPIITGIIEDSKKASFERSVDNINHAAELYISKAEINDDTVQKGRNIYSKISKEISGSKPSYAEVISDGNGNIAYAIEYNNFCFKKDYSGNKTITDMNDCKIRSELPKITSFQSVNSIFFNSGLKRNQIEKIVMLDTNIVPEEYTSNSFKITDDGNIMGYYTDIDNNELYEVYIGSSSGIVTANKNSQYLFANMSNLKEIDLTNFDTSNVKIMGFMFYYCNSLVNLDLTSFDTSNVKIMYGTFWVMNALESINLSSFDTSNVEDMTYMFQGDANRKLKELDLSSFNTSRVTNMSDMFANYCEDYCTNFNTLNLSSFDTSNVTDMSNMFLGCYELTTNITIKNPNVTNYTDMFKDAAIVSDSKITVNYIDSTSSLVDNMINTKSDTSNVIKGEKVS